MKILLVFMSVFGLSFAGLEIPDHLRAGAAQLRRACMAETNVEEKYIDQSKNGFIPDVPELKCYILCFLEHVGMIEEDGTIYFDEIMHLLPPSNQESVKYVSAECQTKHGDTRCETAYLTFKCFFEKVPEGSELP